MSYLPLLGIRYNALIAHRHYRYRIMYENNKLKLYNHLLVLCTHVANGIIYIYFNKKIHTHHREKKCTNIIIAWNVGIISPHHFGVFFSAVALFCVPFYKHITNAIWCEQFSFFFAQPNIIRSLSIPTLYAIAMLIGIKNFLFIFFAKYVWWYSDFFLFLFFLYFLHVFFIFSREKPLNILCDLQKFHASLRQISTINSQQNTRHDIECRASYT